MQSLLVKGPWNDSRTGATYQGSRVARRTPFAASSPQQYKYATTNLASKEIRPEAIHPSGQYRINGPRRLEGQARRAVAPPLHERSPFDQRISDYLTEDKKPDLSLMVCDCMEHGNVDVLAYILANENIESLCMEGPLSERALKTLTKAMSGPLHVTELTVSKECFDADKCKLLFKAMRHMPALEKLTLRKVTEEGGFDQLDCPDFPVLAELDVLVKSDAKAGGFRLPLKILRACKVRRLSIEESGTISIDKHSKLANLLAEQSLLESLRLKIGHRGTTKQFECYMPFLCGKTPRALVQLNLNGSCIQVHQFNQLIEALSSNQPALESLHLSECSVAGDPASRETGSINLLPLAKIKTLRHLDLSGNHLPRGKLVALLTTLKEAATPLVDLNVSGNQIGPQAISAMASLLWNSKTLCRLSFEAPVGQADFVGSLAMLELIEAVEHNHSLLELQFRWTRDLDEYRASVDASLDRNRRAPLVQAAMQTTATFVPLFLNRPWTDESLTIPKLPHDMIKLIEQELTERDALTLSSLDHETRASYEEFLRKAGS
ncbi:hypothetical protein [Variovorax sp. DT-64]|uniref:hypothetical protein n=1 Tax=Variovorax sp. DT-64 TaxID=3396160 RepID=UPI003F5422D8